MHMCFNGFSFLNALMNQWKNCVYPLYLLSTTVVFAALTSLLTTFIIHQIFPSFKTARVSKNILRIINTIASIWLSDYLAYLFLEAHSFIRAWLSENCSLLETDNVHGQISELIIHQIFSLARDWSKSDTRMNIPQLNLGNVREIFPNFQILRVVQKIWRIINTIAFIWSENIMRYLSLDIICVSKGTFFLELRSRKTVRLSEQIMPAFSKVAFSVACVYAPPTPPPLSERERAYFPNIPGRPPAERNTVIQTSLLVFSGVGSDVHWLRFRWTIRIFPD